LARDGDAVLTVDVTLPNALMSFLACYFYWLTSVRVVRAVRDRLDDRAFRGKAHAAAKHGSGRLDRPAGGEALPFVVVVIPARNEACVIEATLDEVRGIDYPHLMILVMNDGSTDLTGELARSHSRDPRVRVVDRLVGGAGTGKGAVLNHAFHLLDDMVSAGEPVFGGRDARNVIVGVIDADGELSLGALEEIAECFRDDAVGACQVGVRIANVSEHWLTRLQDLEFVGFCGHVQDARDALGSVGLGGNGQFARLAALKSLGADPWTSCLAEDLDLGLNLALKGWRIRYCAAASVAQQGLTRVAPLLRQRTRWIQGHYQCWRHLPAIATSTNLRLLTKLDLFAYLLMVAAIPFVFLCLISSLLSLVGLLELRSPLLAWIESPQARLLVELSVSFGPAAILVGAYQRNANHRLRWFEIPVSVLALPAYSCVFVISQVHAWQRMLSGDRDWVKTPRVDVG
jgi:1,2-diacylglycerol 3-beta-glucosyltransferase